MDVKFWKQSDWLPFQNGSRHNGTDSTAYSFFMEDGSGVPIPEGVRDDLCDSVHGFWQEMLMKGKTPTPYTEAPYRTTEDFWVTMEGKYPWLRFCEGHWKVKSVWKNCYLMWRKSHLPETSTTEKGKIAEKTRPATTNQDDSETRLYIKITSDEDSPIGSKHRCINELDARPPRNRNKKR